MSRIYHNQPLKSIPVSSFNYPGQWSPESFQRSGLGVILEGAVQARSRHVIIDKAQKKSRYFILHTKVLRAHKRQFDSSGKEIEPNFSETQKVRTGFLHSSYKTEAKGETDRLMSQDVERLVNHSELLTITDKYHVAGCLALWIEEAELEKMEIGDGDEIRIKTKGDSPFIASIAKLEGQMASVSNYVGGEQVGASWTDKVMMVKKQDQEKSLPQNQNEGVDEDEWDD